LSDSLNCPCELRRTYRLSVPGLISSRFAALRFAMVAPLGISKRIAMVHASPCARDGNALAASFSEVSVDPRELLLTAARAFAVFVLMMVVIRALGKRTVGNFSAFDLLVALMLGEVVDEIIYGDVTFLQGTVAIVVIGALAFTDSFLSYSSHTMQRVLEGSPTVMIRHGKFQRDGMKAEHLNEIDLVAMLRLHGIRDRREVALAVLETDGELSVIPEEWAEPARRADVDAEAAAAREDATNGKEEPPDSMRTDTPRALGESPEGKAA
jgi:uncharacterized membrane protein YcaP (DUF421 family)